MYHFTDLYSKIILLESENYLDVFQLTHRNYYFGNKINTLRKDDLVNFFETDNFTPNSVKYFS